MRVGNSGRKTFLLKLPSHHASVNNSLECCVFVQEIEQKMYRLSCLTGTLPYKCVFNLWQSVILKKPTKTPLTCSFCVPMFRKPLLTVRKGKLKR